jgi:hypothetical protein
MIGRKEKVSYIAVDTMPNLIDAEKVQQTNQPVRYERGPISRKVKLDSSAQMASTRPMTVVHEALGTKNRTEYNSDVAARCKWLWTPRTTSTRRLTSFTHLSWTII